MSLAKKVLSELNEMNTHSWETIHYHDIENKKVFATEWDTLKDSIEFIDDYINRKG
jgi:hypothetical protein